MNRSLPEIFAIAKALLAIYEPVKGKTLTSVEALAVAGQVLGVLNAHQVTLAELEALLTDLGPFLPLLAK